MGGYSVQKVNFCMGGTKKKSMSQAEKSQGAQEAAQGSAPKKPEKKTAKEARFAQQQAKQQALIAPKMDEKQLIKVLGPMKAITLYGTARALGLNAAIASQTLRNLEAKNALRKVGGYSGHYIYQVVAPESSSSAQSGSA
jgi:small subunit ribosomal protein S25e